LVVVFAFKIRADGTPFRGEEAGFEEREEGFKLNMVAFIWHVAATSDLPGEKGYAGSGGV
jgi:hypothetical protein